jgi:hypothetical protein
VAQIFFDDTFSFFGSSFVSAVNSMCAKAETETGSRDFSGARAQPNEITPA